MGKKREGRRCGKDRMEWGEGGRKGEGACRKGEVTETSFNIFVSFFFSASVLFCP